jgi:hypothetical protein
MTFESCVMLVCDCFLSQRTFDLVVVPALADLEFEQEAGRRSRIAGRAAVARALAGAVCYDMLRGSSGFFKLALLSTSYFMFPVAVSVRVFKTWPDFFTAAAFVLVMSLVPVMVCFWPERHPVRHGD